MCDGSLSADLPHDRLKELFNVQVFIVSQVNPHVVKFLENPAIDPNGDRPGPPSFFKRLIVRCIVVETAMCIAINYLISKELCLANCSCVCGNFMISASSRALLLISCARNGRGT
jgi:hypothetical protein